MTCELVFALPASSDEVSGGNLFNAQLIRALALRQDLTVSVLSVARCRARIEQGRAGHYFIDSLDFADFASFPARVRDQHVRLIVHHLPSLEPDVAADDPALQLERAVLPRFDGFIATSPFTAELLRERGFDPAQILTVLPAPPAAVAAVATPTPPFVFSMAGNLIPRKGYVEFFERLAQHMNATHQFQFEVAGRSDLDLRYAERCRQLVQGCELRARVRFVDAVPFERMRECYARAAAFVSASKMETFGMALQEARVHGLPILAVDGGYTRHHFSADANGLLFQSSDALARGVLALVREPARMLELVRSAQRMRAAHDYTWTDAAESFVQQLFR